MVCSMSGWILRPKVYLSFLSKLSSAYLRNYCASLYIALFVGIASQSYYDAGEDSVAGR